MGVSGRVEVVYAPRASLTSRKVVRLIFHAGQEPRPVAGADMRSNVRPCRRSAELQFGAFGWHQRSGFAPNWNAALRRLVKRTQPRPSNRLRPSPSAGTATPQRSSRLSVSFATRRFWTAAGSASATPLWGRAGSGKRRCRRCALPPQTKTAVLARYLARTRGRTHHRGMHLPRPRSAQYACQTRPGLT
jgi:hypothetical protein